MNELGEYFITKNLKLEWLKNNLIILKLFF